MATAFLLLGTNIEPRTDHLTNARALIGLSCGKIRLASSIYETAAWGKVPQDDYLNQVLEIETALAADALLQHTAQIEDRLGRKRKVVWGPRTIDIDILFYDKLVLSTHEITLPHPHIADRRFVLTPLAEIAPDHIHPVLQKSTAELLKNCTDPLWVEKRVPIIR